MTFTGAGAESLVDVTGHHEVDEILLGFARAVRAAGVPVTQDRSVTFLDACRRLGLTLIDAPLDSRDAPPADRVRRARDLFRTIEYPALIHCKSGADRAGLMAVMYRHFHLGQPVSVAMAELGKRTLHHREGQTGVLDYVLERYVAEGEPEGLDLLQWVERPDYDPKAIRADFKASWWGTLLTERLLRRE